MVRRGSERLNHPELKRNYPTLLVRRPGCIMVRTGSEELNHPELKRNYHTLLVGRVQDWFPVMYYGSNRFGRVEPPRTDVKLHYRPVFLCCAMVRTGSEELNHTELMSYDRYSLWSSVVREGSKVLNHTELMRKYPIILASSIAQWFEEVR